MDMKQNRKSTWNGHDIIKKCGRGGTTTFMAMKSNARMIRIEGANILETVEVEMKGCRQVSTEFWSFPSSGSLARGSFKCTNCEILKIKLIGAKMCFWWSGAIDQEKDTFFRFLTLSSRLLHTCRVQIAQWGWKRVIWRSQHFRFSTEQRLVSLQDHFFVVLL